MSDAPNLFAALDYGASDAVDPPPPDAIQPPRDSRRQIVLGVVGVLLGGALVLAPLIGSSQAHGGGANAGYHAGQVAGWVFGLAFLIAGSFAVRNGVRAQRGFS